MYHWGRIVKLLHTNVLKDTPCGINAKEGKDVTWFNIGSLHVNSVRAFSGEINAYMKKKTKILNA